MQVLIRAMTTLIRTDTAEEERYGHNIIVDATPIVDDPDILEFNYHGWNYTVFASEVEASNAE